MTPLSLRHSLSHLVVCALLLIFSWPAQSAISLADPLPINPLLKLGKLENGLTYYIQPNNKPEKRVELRLVVKAGSILEDDDQQGLAHFTEHMAFNGSRHFKKHELISYLQSIGIKFGADLNAYTGFNETVYILPVPTEKKENLQKAFLVLEDWAHGLTLNDADIDAERNIILEEARLGKGAADRMNRKLYSELFNSSKYAERIPIGKEDIIRRFPYDAIKRFYTDWYRPDLMAVVVVGDIDSQQAERMVRKHFSHLKNPTHERPRIYPTIPVRSKTTSLVITDPEATNNVELIQYPVQPARPEITIDDYRTALIRNLNFAMLNQRLQELTQQANPPFLFGSSAIGPVVHGYESFSSTAAIGRAGIEAATNALIQESERARQFGFFPDELERAKKNLQRFIETAYNERNKSNSSEFAKEYVRHFLTDEAIPGIVNEYTYVTELLPGITLDEVNQYAKNNIPNGQAKLVAYLGSSNDTDIIPTNHQLLNWIQLAEHLPVNANSDKALPANLMTQTPKAGSIVAESHDKQLGLTELTLSNGLKVILKPTDFKSDQVLLVASRFGGQSLVDDADIISARYANAIVESMGLANYTPTDLQKILAGKSIAFRTASGDFIETLTGNAVSADLESLFQLMYLRLAPPRIDPNLYSAYTQRMQDVSKNALAKPEVIFSNTLISTLYNNNPRVALVTQPADFDRINLDQVTAIYTDRFTSAKGFTFILAGNFDLEKIKPLIAQYLASLPVADLRLTYRDLDIRPVTGVVKQSVHRGREDKSEVAIVFTGSAQYSKEEKIRFNALVEVMNLRITDVLREKLTLIYSGNMNGVLNRIPYQNYRLNLLLPCSPDNVDKVITAALFEIEKLKSAGPTQEELNKVKLNWINNHDIAMRTNEYWLGNLHNSILFNTDPADILTVKQRVSAVTTQDVQGAAQRYLNTENYVQVVLYPEDKMGH